MPVWLPPRISRELAAVTQAHRAEVVQAARRDALCDYWDRELQKIDPALTIFQAKEDATVPGLKPGYWHICRDNPGAPPSLLPLVGDDGEFVEPTSKMLEVLRAGDLQNRRAMEDRARRDEEAERRRERERQDAHEERVSEMLDRLASATQTRVSMTDAAPWSQNVQGRRGAKGG